MHTCIQSKSFFCPAAWAPGMIALLMGFAGLPSLQPALQPLLPVHACLDRPVGRSAVTLWTSRIIARWVMSTCLAGQLQAACVSCKYSTHPWSCHSGLPTMAVCSTCATGEAPAQAQGAIPKATCVLIGAAAGAPVQRQTTTVPSNFAGLCLPLQGLGCSRHGSQAWQGHCVALPVAQPVWSSSVCLHPGWPELQGGTGT